MANNELFHKNTLSINHPITADMVMLQWDGGDVAQANQFQMQYQQQATRRYTLGGLAAPYAAIIPGRPVGTITIGRLFIADTSTIFGKAGWSTCTKPANIIISFQGRNSVNAEECLVDNNTTYTAWGAYVTGYSFQADADSLNVVDNITIEFLQLTYTGNGKVNPSAPIR